MDYLITWLIRGVLKLCGYKTLNISFGSNTEHCLTKFLDTLHPQTLLPDSDTSNAVPPASFLVL
jgi:hypothetical protein